MIWPVVSVVIPAHDEGAVIGRCLGALLADARPGEFEVVVVANGCRDDTARRAREQGVAVRVVELDEPGKTRALNAGDQSATVFPRLYLDADVVLSTATARELADLLGGPVPTIGGARIEVDASRSSRMVRAYYRVWSSLPAMTEGYVGSGVYGVSAAGHARLAPFPDLVADDAYARRSFRATESMVSAGAVRVIAPRRLRDLLRRGIRVHAGNLALPARGTQAPRGLAGVQRADGTAVDKACYLGVTALLKVGARWRTARGRGRTWTRDESSRVTT